MAVALGSNLGDRRANLEAALDALAPLLSGLQAASLYESPAWPRSGQPDFLNSAVRGSTPLSPEELLAALKGIEKLLGRRRGRRWGPRRLDLDLLVHGDSVARRPELTLPHPMLERRRFVLVPLCEIAPRLAIPPHGRTVTELVTRLRTSEPIPRLVAAPGDDRTSWA